MLVFRKVCVRTKWMITLDENYQESITEGYLGSYQSSMMKLFRCRNVETVAQNSLTILNLQQQRIFLSKSC